MEILRDFPYKFEPIVWVGNVIDGKTRPLTDLPRNKANWGQNINIKSRVDSNDIRRSVRKKKRPLAIFKLFVGGLFAAHFRARAYFISH